MTYQDGTSTTPVVVFDDSEGFDVCRERDRPVVVKSEETGEVFKAYPSGHSRHIRFEPPDEREVDPWEEAARIREADAACFDKERY